jgi:ABC-2 type transport system permease protein
VKRVLHRILALAGKEFIQIRRDRRTLAMMIVLPLLWLVMFGYAFSFDVEEIAVAVVDQSGTRIGGLVADAVRGYERFRPTAIGELSEAGIRQAMHRDQLVMGVIIPPGYGDAGIDAQVRVLIDGSDLFGAQAGARHFQNALAPVQDEIRAVIQQRAQAEMRARMESEVAARTAELRSKAEATLQGQIEFARRDAERQIEARKAELLAQLPPQLRGQAEAMLAGLRFEPPQLALPADLIQPLSLDAVNFTPPDPPQMLPEIDILYNPNLRSADVMIPGLLGLVTMFMAIMMTAIGVVREREYGTLEQLVVTPIQPVELMVGKLIPYAIVAIVDFAIVFVAGSYLFDLTFAGNLPVFLGLTALFLITTLGLGLLISTIAQTQQQAMQMAMFMIFPQILLSGLIFPLTSMPKAIQWIANLLPFTYFVPITRGMFIKGQEFELLLMPALVLAAYCVLVVTAASLRFRKRLA